MLVIKYCKGSNPKALILKIDASLCTHISMCKFCVCVCARVRTRERTEEERQRDKQTEGQKVRASACMRACLQLCACERAFIISVDCACVSSSMYAHKA